MQDNGSFDFIALEMNAHSVGRQAQRLAFAAAVSCGRPDIAQDFSEEAFQNAYDETVWNFDEGIDASVREVIDEAVMSATEHLVISDLEQFEVDVQVFVQGWFCSRPVLVIEEEEWS